jgi:hypothetical protein
MSAIVLTSGISIEGGKMHGFRCGPVVLVALSIGMATMIVGGSGTATMAVAHSPSWSSLQDEALGALSTYSHGSAESMGELSAEQTSSVTSTSGDLIQIQERAFNASVAGTTSEVELTWLGDTQLVVNQLTFGASPTSVTLVLAPDTSNISNAYQSPISVTNVPQSANSELANLQKNSNQSPRRIQVSTSRRKGNAAHLATFFFYGACEEAVVAPSVELTIFGYLIYGIAAYVNNSCNGAESFFEDISGFNDATGASGNPTPGPVSAIAYWPCSSGGPNFFDTETLFNVNGSFYAPSAGAELTCG